MKYIKCILSLTLICAVIAVMLAAANYITAPIIAANESAAANEALLIVMPNGEGFAAVDTAEYELPASVNEVYTEKNGGVVVTLTTTGFNPNLKIMVGVDGGGTVTGATCLSSEETLGYEKTYGDSVLGATADTIDSVDTIAGATKTTAAYRAAVKDALSTAIIVGGGSVDIRSEAEILADNLAAALPAGDTFTPVFIVEELENVSAVYTADNGAGSVFVIGESFVGIDAGGAVVGDVDAETKAIAEAAAAKQSASSVTEIDITAYEDMPSAVEKAYVTASGNYVFDLKASGYGINGDKYIRSGEYIYIKVSITASGKIIACETVSQKESDGFGSVCAEPSFYSQFNGKTADTYKDIDAISGATVTTNGYTTAISRAFEAVTILTGGASNETAE